MSIDAIDAVADADVRLALSHLGSRYGLLVHSAFRGAAHSHVRYLHVCVYEGIQCFIAVYLQSLLAHVVRKHKLQIFICFPTLTKCVRVYLDTGEALAL